MMSEFTSTEQPAADGVYEWYARGAQLLASGSAAAAAALLGRASAEIPDSRQILELLGRAQYEAGDYLGARLSFDRIVEMDPCDDYATFCLGMSLLMVGDVTRARAALRVAVAMRPDNRDYSAGLRRAKATTNVRGERPGD